jgi:DNA invertase Pin-like site-specific DNA recombinase
MATKIEPPRRVGIYCRISDDREGRGEGVERQLEACKSLVSERKWTLVDEYIDNDISATQTRKARPSYLRLLEDLKNGRINTIVVWAVDRLYRRPIELEDLLKILDHHSDISVNVVQGSDLRLETSDGQVMARVLVALAKRETDLLTARIQLKMDELARAGKPHGGARTFGYSPDQLSINEEEAEIVRKMAKMFLANRSTNGVVLWLQKEGIKTARGGEWRRKTVNDILRNPRIAGYRSHHGTLYKAVWPAIISEEDWQEIRSILSERDRRTSPGNKSKYLLTGLVYCGNCGHKMGNMTRGKNLNSTNTYACRSDPALLLRGCGSCRMFGAWVDEWVTTAVIERLSRDATLLENLSQPKTENSQREHSELLQALTNIRSKSSENQDLWLEGTLTKPEYERALNKLSARRMEIERRLDKMEAATPVSKLLGSTDLNKSWDERSIEEKRALLSLVIKKVIINKSTSPGRNTFDRRRVEIVWREEF